MSRRWTVAVVIVALLGGACAGGDEPSTQTSPEPTGTVAPSPSPSPSPPSTPAPQGPPAEATLDELAGVRVRLTEVATVERPVAMAARPGHDPLFVAERGGRVMVIDDGEVRPKPLLEVETTTDGERGLLGLAFSSDGGHLYVHYTDAAGDSRVEEHPMGEGATEVGAGEPRTLLHVSQPFSNHNGGHVAVGPDGLLYVGLGDGGGAGDPHGNGQDTETLLGTILRIDPRAQGDAPYGIPGDNPFANGGGRGEIYVYGLRNPWRFSFDRATDDLWIADVGQNAVEEVNRLPAASAAGANMGWPALEGSRPFEGDPPPDAVPPVYEYNHDDGITVIGGFVYRGQRIPGLRGAYVFGDLSTARLWALGTDENGGLGRHDLGVGVEEMTLVSFGEDADGELYVLSLAGPVLRLDPA